MKLQIVLFMLKKNSEQFNYRIYYEDTDAGGVVYYANYLKFFERARTDFLRSIGISQALLAQMENIIFVVKRCVIEYQYPARLDDEISVSVKIKEIHKVSLTMTQEITKSAQLIAQLEVQIVCLNQQNFKPTRLPQKLIDLIHV
jgi:acyl-CoA thioester hydrolase